MKSSRPTHFQKKRKLNPAQLGAVYMALRKAFGPQKWWPGDTPFEVIIGAILTQNTAWTNVEKAIRNLKQARKLSLRALDRISREELSRLIRPAGYFNIKADRLKCFVDFLKKECRGDLSKLRRQAMTRLREKLLGVKGIGPETADSILVYALEKASFVIDAYTRRIFSRHGLEGEEESYERWREIFTGALPGNLGLYNDFHAQIVRLAKEHCRKIPHCSGCPLNCFF